MLEKDAKQVTRMTHCRGHIYPPPQKTSYAAVSIFFSNEAAGNFTA